MLALVIVPVISVAVRKFGRFLRELSHQTQAAAAVASSIAEVCISVILFEDEHGRTLVEPYFNYCNDYRKKQSNTHVEFSFQPYGRILD